MGERVGNIKIERKEGYLYFTKGDPISIYRVKMQHKGRKKGKGGTSTLVMRTGVKRAKGYLYYIDRFGYLCKTRVKRR